MVVAAGAVAAGLLTHTIVSNREFGSDKLALLAKQRAMAATLGAQWFPLRDDTWIRAVKDADDDMRLRVFSEQYDSAVREEIPLAIDVITRAAFFLLVLDEDGDDAAGDHGGLPTEESLQLVAHPARIQVFDLRTNQEIVRLRRSGSALVIPTGERSVTDPETREAMQRQANNCALAGLVESAIGEPGHGRAAP
jgi:hypothetical protein